jgi:hypothetical protein
MSRRSRRGLYNILHSMKKVSVAAVDLDVTATFLQRTTNSANASSYTFSSNNIGTASADRVIVAVVQFRPTSAAQTVTTCVMTTNGGMTELAEASTNFGTTTIYAFSAPTGTTDTFTVTLSGAANGCALSLFQLNNSAAVAFDTLTDTTGVAGLYTGTIDCEAGGCIIGGNAIITTAGNNFTWVGITERYDDTMQADTNLEFSGASDVFATAQTGLTVSSTITSGGTSGSMAVVAISKV